MTKDNLYSVRTAPHYADPNLVYVGEAYPSSVASSGVWCIKRIDNTGGEDNTIVLYADGNTYFDNIWDDRETLNYF